MATTTHAQVPLDLAHWQQVASESYPNGLPKPYSDDPKQWIMHGHPSPPPTRCKWQSPACWATAGPLRSSRPAGESSQGMELSDAARAWIAHCKDLDSLGDDDGIRCLPAVRGVSAAAERLRAMLIRAFGKNGRWPARQKLLQHAGCDCLPLAQWLRDKFFQ